MKQLFFSLLIFSLLSVSAQHPERNRANIWYFGNGAGLDFSSGSPEAITDGVIFTGEGSAVISDLNGNLMFYTDGLSVWDKNHNLMPNGSGLLGCIFGSSTQAALIVAHPTLFNLYYLFVTDCDENGGLGGLSYSVVDISLNNGLGDIISKNNVLFSPSTEKLTGVNCGKISWIAGIKHSTNEFYAYKIDSLGLDVTPIISNIGSIHTQFWGGMKFSPNGKMLATTLNTIENINEVFQFDIIAGKLSNPLKLKAYGGEYSLSFSPDNSKLYYTANGNTIYQYDVSTYDEDIINASRQFVINSFDNSDFFGLQLATDSLIYVSGASKDSISCFLSPNLLGINSSFSKNKIYLNGRQSLAQLPNFIESYFNTQSIDCFEKEKCYIRIPNIFTPNNDEINDVFSIALKGYKQASWKIYNRWEQVLWEDELNIENKEKIELWDGKLKNGETATSGTYYYVLDLTPLIGIKERKRGHITLTK